MKRRDSQLAIDVLRWLARLPFLAVDDLALLTGRPDPDIESILLRMKQDARVDAVMPSSPELDSAPLHVLAEPTRRWLESTLDAETTRALPLAWRDIVHSLARLEATVAFNAFAGRLVGSLRRGVDREVVDVRSLPIRRPQDAWWPPGVQGYGCIRSADGAAPFFVAVDRAGAPAAHRAALVAGWYRFRVDSRVWGSNIPPILVLCPGRAREDEWARAVLASAKRRDAAPLRVVLGGVATAANGFAEPVWRQPGGAGGAALLEWLPVCHAGHLALPPVAMPEGLLRSLSGNRQPLHRWARAVANDGRAASIIERTAALALTTSTVEKQMIECLSRHPLLTEAELAVVLYVDPRVARQAAQRAAARGLIVRVERPGDHRYRYSLGTPGLETLAVRDGVPVRRYARHAPITVFSAVDSERMPTLLQQHEHTVGANSFFIAWLRAGTEGGPRLTSWLSAADSAIRFESGGRRRWLRPDGSGVVLANGVGHQLLLEWDRGTERVAVLAGKLTRYAAYYQSCRMNGAVPPTLLFVTTTPQRERLVWDLAARVLQDFAACLRTTTAPLLHRLGPSDAIWQSGAGQARMPWPSTVRNQNRLARR